MRNVHGFMKKLLYLLPALLLIAGTAIPASAYNVSGTVSYSGSKSGQIYLSLQNSNGLGTSIPVKGAFTIRGVPNGSYNLNAYMDNIGNGFQHASNPIGSTSVTVSNGNATADVALADPSVVTPSAPAWVFVAPADGGVYVRWDAPTQNGIQIADSYSVYWGTDSGLNTGSRLDIPADDQNFLVVNGLTNGQSYYFRVTAKTGSSGNAASDIAGPVTVGAPTGGYNVSGTVTLNNFTATGHNLYVAVTDNSSKMFVSRIASPVSPQSFTVSGVQNGNYMVYVFVDMNDDGILNLGDIENGSSAAPSITVNNGAVTGLAITLKKSDVHAKVRTDHYSGIGPASYTLNFDVQKMTKQPVNVVITGGPAGITYPTDIAFNSENGGFAFWAPESPTPVTGDIYTFSVTYSDTTSDSNVQATITGINSSFPTIVSPVGSISGPGSTTPTFSWTAPVPLPSGANFYQLWLSPQNQGDIWASDKIPIGNTSVPYNNDGSASQPALTPGTTYIWAVGVQDSIGNRAYAQSSFNVAAITVSGIVADSPTMGGAPISGAKVELIGNPSVYTTTDGSGHFSLPGLPYGTNFALKTSKDGYLPSYSANINSIYDIADPAATVLFTATEVNMYWGVPAGKGAITAIAVDAANWASNQSGVTVTAASALHPSSPYPVTYFNGTLPFSGSSTFSNGLVFVLNVDDGDTVTLHATKTGWGFYDSIATVHGDSVSEALLMGAPAQRTLSVAVPGAGTGSGTVTGSGQRNSTTVDLSFGTNYSGAFDTGTQVTLHAAAGQYSTFTGWSGACTGTGDCAVTMDTDKSATATFDFYTAHKAHTAGTSNYFPTLQEAYNDPSSTGNTNAILAWGVDFTESLNASQSKTVSIKGGYDSGYSLNTGYTNLIGSLTIGAGTVTVENLVVK